MSYEWPIAEGEDSTLPCAICRKVRSDVVHDPGYCGSRPHPFVPIRKKILICGDSPTVATGFSHCTKSLASEMYNNGWEVHILALSYFGDPHNYPYHLYSCYNPLEAGLDSMGYNRLPDLIYRLSPDVVVILNDPWNIPGFYKNIDSYSKTKEELGHGPLSLPPIIGWLAVDSKNQKGYECNRLDHVVVWTRFAQDELRSGGYTGSSSIVPLGVNHDIFYPRDRAESRKMVCPDSLPEDAYLIGCVGRNQPRKRLDLTIAYFAEWIRRYRIDDAYLYLYTSPTGEKGCDIQSLADYHLGRHGIKGRIIMPQDMRIGVGNEECLMPYFYSAFNLLFSTSQAEGWGLPMLEAMACGCPVLCSDWAALGSQGGWTGGEGKGSAVARVSCTSTALTAPLNGGPYTIGGVMDREAAIMALHRLYSFESMRKDLSERGRLLASQFSWNETGRQMREEIERVVNEKDLVSMGGKELCVMEAANA